MTRPAGLVTQAAAPHPESRPAMQALPGQFLDLPGLLTSGTVLATGSILNGMNIRQLPELLIRTNHTRFTTFFSVLQFLCGLLSVLVGFLGVIVSTIRIRKKVIITNLLFASGLAILSAICLTIGALETKETWSDARSSIDNFAKILMNFVNTVCSVCLCIALTRRVHRYRDYVVCRFENFRLPVMVCTAVIITTSIASLSSFASGVLLSVSNKTNYAGGLHMGVLGLTLGLAMVLNLKLIVHQSSTIACLLLAAFALLSSGAAAYTENLELEAVVGSQKTRKLHYGFIIKAAVVYFSALLNITTIGALAPCQFLRLWHIAVIERSPSEPEDGTLPLQSFNQASPPNFELNAGTGNHSNDIMRSGSVRCQPQMSGNSAY